MDTQSNWLNFIQAQKRKYPEMQIQDLYKLVYQATFGPAHLGTDSTQVLHYLELELADIQSAADESLTTPISPNGQMLRVNLKKFKSMNGKPTVLVTGIVLSATENWSSSTDFLSIWTQIRQLIQEEKTGFTIAELGAFENSTDITKLPVLHHSEAYQSAYKPAYRVLSQKQWNLLGSQMFEPNIQN
jgi:hypothetical protein